MWHAVTPVLAGYDPILYESPEAVAKVLILNAGPSPVVAKAWKSPEEYGERPPLQVELRPGDQRVVGGCLVRVALKETDFPPTAAVAWAIL